MNMDYLFFSTIQHSGEVVVLNVSYDIACQWSKNIWARMSKYASHLHFECDRKTMTFLIPKFHLPAHITAVTHQTCLVVRTWLFCSSPKMSLIIPSTPSCVFP